MAASSVTGVGPGSADGRNKGSEHTSMHVSKLIGPRLVSCGQVVLGGGTPSSGAVTFTQSLSSAAGYFVTATPVGSSTGAVNVSAVATTGFVVTGANGSSATVNWSLVYNPDPANGVMI
jgi:hypothetical protein